VQASWEVEGAFYEWGEEFPIFEKISAAKKKDRAHLHQKWSQLQQDFRDNLPLKHD